MKPSQITSFPMMKGELITIARPKDCVIQVDSGRLWITQTNQSDDIFIDAGRACSPKQNGFLVAEAMSNTVMSMAYVKPGTARAGTDETALAASSRQGA